jgi:LPS export ABC transporter protein LptC
MFRVRIRFCLLVALCVSASASCSNRSAEEILTEEEGARLPDQIIMGFDVTITDEGVKKTQVEAEKAYVYEDVNQILARKLDVKFFSTTGEFFSQLWADSGMIDMESNDMVAIHNVVVVTNDSLRLETQSLNWDDEDEMISTEDSVVFYKKDETVRGKGLYSDPGLKDVVIMSPTGRFKDRNGKDKD